MLVGSGATAESLPGIMQYAEGVGVGTSIKRDGVTTNQEDGDRAEALVQAMAALRGCAPAATASP